jgi:hypothetical protein
LRGGGVAMGKSHVIYLVSETSHYQVRETNPISFFSTRRWGCYTKFY